MAQDETFAAKLDLILKALAISRGRLAADVGVDKSLVGRWCSGTIKPSAHNCARLTQVIAARLEGFTQHDWDLDFAALAARLGVTIREEQPDRALPSAFAAWLALSKFDEAARASGASSRALAGFWRTTRPAPEFPGQFVQDHVIMEALDDGPLRFRIGLFSSRLTGWSMAVGDQMYCTAANHLTGGSIFAIFNRVHRPRLDVLDGVTLACMADAGGVPVAAACLLERVGDLSGDPAADDARYEELLAQHPLPPRDSIPEEIREHLLFDVGPAAMSLGGDPVLMMRAMTSMARGGPCGAPAAQRLRVVG